MIIVITGPTGTGKTELSLFLAKKLNGEIINADSTQVYKGLNIATNKIKNTERIPHHLLNIKNLNEKYTVFDYQKDARKCIEDIKSRDKIPIIVGGSGLYIKAALYDYNFDKKIKKTYDEFTNEELHKKLLKVDPKTNIHTNNRIRLINALNYYETNLKPYSQKPKTETLLYNTIFIGLTASRDVLYSKINERVDNMIDEGLITEAKELYNYSVHSKAIMTPIGYKELFAYFDGTKTKEETIELIKKHSRNYAKRQLTWFKNQMNLKWFITNYDNFEQTEEEVLNYIKENI